MRGCAPRADDPLWNALMVEVGNFLPQVKILEKGRAALSGLQ